MNNLISGDATVILDSFLKEHKGLKHPVKKPKPKEGKAEKKAS